MDHRVWALSIADIIKSWDEETNSKHKFEMLYDIYNGALKTVDPTLDFEVLDTESDIEAFISRNNQYGIRYFPSGHEFLSKYSHYRAISEVVMYGGPKTVDDIDLIVTLQHLCIRKDEFRRWVEASGRLLPKFWFPEIGKISALADAGEKEPSVTTTIDTSCDLSKRERESLQKQIAALALVLAERSNKYRNGDKPNANQIAEAVSEILGAMPDANKHGVSSASLRASIKAGIEVLQGQQGARE